KPRQRPPTARRVFGGGLLGPQSEAQPRAPALQRAPQGRGSPTPDIGPPTETLPALRSGCRTEYGGHALPPRITSPRARRRQPRRRWSRRQPPTTSIVELSIQVH